MFLQAFFDDFRERNFRVIRMLFDYTRSMAAPAGVFGPHRIVVRMIRGFE